MLYISRKTIQYLHWNIQSWRIAEQCSPPLPARSLTARSIHNVHPYFHHRNSLKLLLPFIFLPISSEAIFCFVFLLSSFFYLIYCSRQGKKWNLIAIPHISLLGGKGSDSWYVELPPGPECTL